MSANVVHLRNYATASKRGKDGERDRKREKKKRENGKQRKNGGVYDLLGYVLKLRHIHYSDGLSKIRIYCWYGVNSFNTKYVTPLKNVMSDGCLIYVSKKCILKCVVCL